MACNHSDKVSYHNTDDYPFFDPGRTGGVTRSGTIWCDTCNVMKIMPKMWILPNAVFYAHRLRS